MKRNYKQEIEEIISVYHDPKYQYKDPKSIGGHQINNLLQEDYYTYITWRDPYNNGELYLDDQTRAAKAKLSALPPSKLNDVETQILVDFSKSTKDLDLISYFTTNVMHLFQNVDFANQNHRQYQLPNEVAIKLEEFQKSHGHEIYEDKKIILEQSEAEILQRAHDEQRRKNENKALFLGTSGAGLIYNVAEAGLRGTGSQFGKDVGDIIETNLKGGGQIVENVGNGVMDFGKEIMDWLSNLNIGKIETIFTVVVVAGVSYFVVKFKNELYPQSRVV